MILAAGIGSRLRPLTDKTPKALIDINGVPMFEIVIKRLMKAGVAEVIVNVFHLADQIVDFLKKKENFGIHIEISREDVLLDTGGGLKKAGHFFSDGEPFFVHNADVLSDINLEAMYQFHLKNPALATLAVAQRVSGRYLLFDENNQLCGWQSPKEDKTQWASGPKPDAQKLAFNGIHVISPTIFEHMIEEGVFPINAAYLRLASLGQRVRAFRTDNSFWTDIGDLTKLEKARQQIQQRDIRF